MARKAEEAQRHMLALLDCGWWWATRAGTVKLCEGLYRLGLVDRAQRGTDYRNEPVYRYDLNDAGRKALEEKP